MRQLTPNQQRAMSLDGHMIVTANAGSGKTTVFARRFVKLAETVQVNKIAAITFTNEAASQLLNDITDQVNEQLDFYGSELKTKKGEEKEELIAKRKRLYEIRKSLNSAQISTIHSFCIDLLRKFPVEADIDAGFSTLDDYRANELFDKILEDVTSDYIENNPDDFKELVRFTGSINALRDITVSIVKSKRKKLLNFEEIYAKSIDEIAEFYKETSLKIYEQLFSESLENAVVQIKELNRTILAGLPGNDKAIEAGKYIEEFYEAGFFEDKLIAFQNLVLAITTKPANNKFGTVNKQGYAVKKLGVEDIRSEIDILLQEIPYAEFESSIEKEKALSAITKKLYAFVFSVLREYEEEKSENGLLDFDDLLIKANDLVGNEKVLESLREKYTHIMIDEFQDTDEIQYNIFYDILDGLKAGNLFVVGDDKQSIYMFRSAELEVFEKTKDKINSLTSGDGVISLPDSFRMLPGICLFINEVFKHLFKGNAPEYNEVAFNETICANSKNEPGEVDFIWSEEQGGADSLTVRKIIELVNSGKYQYKDISILARKKSIIQSIEHELSLNKIPYSIVGGRGYYQVQIIYDIFNYFLFLLDNEDDLALVSILRSPFFLLSDADLFTIFSAGTGSFWNRLQLLEDDKFKRITSVLKKNIEYSKKNDPVNLYNEILTDTGFLALISGRSTAGQDLANIRKLSDIIIAYTKEGFKNLFDFVEYLRSSISEFTEEAQAAPGDQLNSVKLMTIHQSKGLQNKVVIVHHIESMTNVRVDKVSVDKELGIVAKIPEQGEYFAATVGVPAYEVFKYISSKKENAELKRLFYVACTRAEEKLILTADKPYRTAKGTFLSLLIEALPIDDTKFFVENDFLDLNGSLKRLVNKEGNYSNDVEDFKLKVNIIKNIENTELITGQKDSENDFRLNIEEIYDEPKDEFISATKINLFKQCSVKYKLTYEIGFAYLENITNYIVEANKSLKNKKSKKDEDDAADKDLMLTQGFSPAAFKGTIVHSLLERNVPLDEIVYEVEAMVKKELTIESIIRTDTGSIIKDVKKMLTGYYKSDVYNAISGYNNFYNEYEIYLKENDYILYGIIDKLIIDGDKLVVVDYKTDEVGEKEIEKKSESYLNQLKFYVYLASKKFPEIKNYSAKLIFIKHPELFKSITVTPEENAAFGKDLMMTVDLIRKKKFTHNKENCRSCHFFMKNKNCVIPYPEKEQ